MKLNFTELWKQNQDLNFGEMREVVRAAENAAEDKKREIVRSKLDALRKPRKKVDHLLRAMRTVCGFSPNL
jgi:predicted phage gp36 major capsid-like protein